MRIDVHNHLFPPAYLSAVGAAKIAAVSSAGRAPQWNPALALESMDRNDVDVAVTSLSAPGFAVVDDRGAIASLARRCNDFSAGLTALRPRRFGMFAALPLPDVDAALIEAAYALDELQADGVCLMSNYDGRHLGHADFEPLIAELDRRGAVAFVHPAPIAGSPHVLGIGPSVLEFAFDTTRTIASLLFSGTLHRRRGVRFIFAHAGGAAPYLCHRMETLSGNVPWMRAAVPDGVIAELRHHYYDTALSAAPGPFASLLELAAPSQLLFGSDFPFGPKSQMREAVAGLAGIVLDDAARTAIDGGNALALLPGLARGLKAA